MKLYWYKGRCNLCGVRVRELRGELELSQEELAAQLQLLGMEVDQRMISRIECGRRVVPDYELKYFSQFFNRPVAWFLEE